MVNITSSTVNGAVGVESKSTTAYRAGSAPLLAVYPLFFSPSIILITDSFIASAYGYPFSFVGSPRVRFTNFHGKSYGTFISFSSKVLIGFIACDLLAAGNYFIFNY